MNESGRSAMKYGSMAQQILSLKVVTPDGKIIQTGQRAKAPCGGYDLTRLFVGTEGTLGIITELTLKLHRIPKVIQTCVMQFNTLEEAVNTIPHASLKHCHFIASLELLDDLCIRAINQVVEKKLVEKPTIILEFHADNVDTLTADKSIIENAAKGFNVQEVHWTQENRDWKTTAYSWFACPKLQPGSVIDISGGCLL